MLSMFKSSIGCGYPPEVSCPSFAQKYSELKKEGKYFHTETLVTHKSQNLVKKIRKKYIFE